MQVGQKVMVSGDIINESWTTSEGDKRSALRITGNRIVISPKTVQATQTQAVQEVPVQEVPVQAAPVTEVPFIPSMAEQAIPDMPF